MKTTTSSEITSSWTVRDGLSSNFITRLQTADGKVWTQLKRVFTNGRLVGRIQGASVTWAQRP